MTATEAVEPLNPTGDNHMQITIHIGSTDALTDADRAALRALSMAGAFEDLGAQELDATPADAPTKLRAVPAPKPTPEPEPEDGEKDEDEDKPAAPKRAPRKAPAAKKPAAPRRKAAAKPKPTPEPEPEEPEEAADEDGAPTMADAVEIATTVVRKDGNPAKVKAALQSLEVERVSQLPADKIADFIAALRR